MFGTTGHSTYSKDAQGQQHETVFHTWLHKLLGFLCLLLKVIAVFAFKSEQNVVPSSNSWIFHEQFTYNVAFESNKVYGELNWLATVSIQNLNLVQQVCEKLVATFQNAQTHYSLITKISNNVTS